MRVSHTGTQCLPSKGRRYRSSTWTAAFGNTQLVGLPSKAGLRGNEYQRHCRRWTNSWVGMILNIPLRYLFGVIWSIVTPSTVIELFKNNFEHIPPRSRFVQQLPAYPAYHRSWAMCLLPTVCFYVSYHDSNIIVVNMNRSFLASNSILSQTEFSFQ